ncbi:MAG: transposase [Pirellulales bacterium]
MDAECPRLSASTITRLMGSGRKGDDWSSRSLAKRYVYAWADGGYFTSRLEEDRQCILVLMAATENGQKELLAVIDGYRESEQSWTELLLDAKSQGVTRSKLAGDAALGFGRPRRRFVPRQKNNAVGSSRAATLSTSCRSGGRLAPKEKLHEIWMADTRERPTRHSTCSSNLPGQVPKAAESLQEGSRRAVGVLQLSGRTLDSSAYDQPDRERILDCHVMHRRRPVATAAARHAWRWSSSSTTLHVRNGDP